jgi:hypothetical protein
MAPDGSRHAIRVRTVIGLPATATIGVSISDTVFAASLVTYTRLSAPGVTATPTGQVIGLRITAPVTSITDTVPES